MTADYNYAFVVHRGYRVVMTVQDPQSSGERLAITVGGAPPYWHTYPGTCPIWLRDKDRHTTSTRNDLFGYRIPDRVHRVSAI